MNKKQLVNIVFVFSAMLFIESSIPFLYAQRKCKPDHVFLGQTISTFDQNMYFSFIRQAEIGHFLFWNNLTYKEHKPAFINLEFWLVGALQRMTGLDENGIYTLWRVLGIVFLVTGFVLLASLIFQSVWKICFAALLFLFSGGIGFIHATLNRLGFRTATGNWSVFGYSSTSSLALDTSSCLMPINQAMTNPHFTMPTGLILIGFYFFMLAEKTRQTKHNIYSGIVFFLIGLIRPYDLLPVLVAIPIYILFTSSRTDFFKKELLYVEMQRLLPVFIILPVLCYNLWLFRCHPIFRYWSSQGDNAQMIPSFWVHYLNFGVIGFLALVRICLIKKVSIHRTELFFVILFVATLIINHSGKYSGLMPWSFQVGAYSAAPLVLIGLVPEYGKIFPNGVYRCLTAILITLIIVSNVAILVFRCVILRDPLNQTHMYAKLDEYNSWMWLRTFTKPGEILLATTYTSSRIAKYTDLRVVTGHPFVTPDYEATSKLAMQVNFDSTISQRSMEVLEQLHVDYIYVGPNERTNSVVKIKASAYVTPVFSNAAVDIYRINHRANPIVTSPL